MLQFRAGMNGRQILALLNFKPIQLLQFNTKTAAATLALQKQQTREFWPTKVVRNSSGIASSVPELNVQQEEATAKNEEFPVEKEEDEGKIEQQQLEGAEKQEELVGPVGEETVGVGPATVLARRSYSNTRNGLHVNYRIGQAGQKFLLITKRSYNFPKIHIPEDVFDFVRAMDEVLETAHANKKKIIEASPNRHERLVLYTAEAKGMFYDFQLELYVLENCVLVQVRTVPNEHKPEHKPKMRNLQLHQFHWLRNAIGELFAANGEENVQQQLGKAPSYPAWLNRDGIPLAFLSNLRTQKQKQQKQPNAAPQTQMPPQQQQAMLQQLLQLVLQQQQQLQQMQAANAFRNNNLGFGVVPQGADQTILMSDLLAQQQQQTMHNNQFDQTALANLLAQFQQPQQPMASTMNNNNNQLMNLVNLLLKNNSGPQN